MATQGLKGITENVTGYYAFTALDPHGDLHIVKDNCANLFFAEIETIESYVFATTKESILNVCKAMEWKHSVIEQLKDNHYLVYKDNELIKQEEFKPLGRTAYESSYAQASLGRSLGPQDDDYYSGWNREYHSPKLVKETGLTNGITENESIDLFLEEIRTMADASYVILDHRNNEIPLEDFLKMPDEDKIYYTVIREDGTIVDAFDYYHEQIWKGAM